MNITIRNRPTYGTAAWEAITRYPSGIVETLTCWPSPTPEDTRRVLTRMQEVGMLPAEINITVEEERP